MEGGPIDQQSRRLVKIRKRKSIQALSDQSNIMSGHDKENMTPTVKRMKKEYECETRPPLCVEHTVEWSLKTKARFLSPHPFDWSKVKRAREESQGLAAFIRRQRATLEPVSELQSHLMYWEHPSLPSLSMFAEGRQRAGLAPLREEAFVDALKEDWSTSFRSLFQLFRSGTCPHFYLCATTMTILFTTSDPGSTTAVISPTTSGFRQALTREGVEFTLPLDKTQPPPPEEPQESETEDDCSSWLDSVIGPEERAVKKINTKAGQQQSIDSRPESVVLVPSSSLQSLFNYLLNCKTLVSPTGPMAGVPPTLVSPVAFQGATLRALKASVGSMCERSRPGLKKTHYMDIVGPILPNTMKQLRTLLSRTQQDFTVHTVDSNYTSVFNRVAGLQ